MKRIKRLSTASTIIAIISVLIYIAIALLLLPEASDTLVNMTGESFNRIDSVDSNSPSAGFEVLIYLFGGLLGLFGGLFLFLIYVFLASQILYQLPSIISGIVANIRLKKGNNIVKCIKTYKVDGLIKVIMSGIFVAWYVFLVLGELGNASLFDILALAVFFGNYIAVFVLSILQLKNIKAYNKNAE